MSAGKTASFRLTRTATDGRELVIRGDAFLARNAGTGVIICHGFKGFARWGIFPYVARRVAEAGLNAVTFDFSGSGLGDDRETFTELEAFAQNTYGQEQADLDMVAAEATRRGWIGDSYGLFGHSRGGGSAILYAARNPRVRALVTWAAIAHVLRWMPEERREWRERGYTNIVNQRTGQVLRLGTALLDECERSGETDLSIERAAAAITAPWLIMHGTADEAVPSDNAERLYAVAGGGANPRVTLELLEGVNHVFGAAHPLRETPPVLERATTRTVGFFTEHLK